MFNARRTPPFLPLKINTDGEKDIHEASLPRPEKKCGWSFKFGTSPPNGWRCVYPTDWDSSEVETPILLVQPPEGARDFVESLTYESGAILCFAAPPSYSKQLLMALGSDRYFQIAKCFRDEDLRADHQPEFSTNWLGEMSFVEQEDVITIFEGMAKHLFKNHSWNRNQRTICP